MKIKDLPKETNLRGLKLKDGTYFWSAWRTGVWVKKDLNSAEVFPLFIKEADNIKEIEVWED